VKDRVKGAGRFTDGPSPVHFRLFRCLDSSVSDTRRNPRTVHSRLMLVTERPDLPFMNRLKTALSMAVL